MNDLVEFLRARLDEDEELAQAAPRGPWGEDASHCVVDATGVRVICSVNGGTLRPTLAVRAHVLGHDPARVLREVEAKRQLLTEYAEVAHNDGAGSYEYGYGWADGLGLAVRCTAAAYADHPDYRPEWAPNA